MSRFERLARRLVVLFTLAGCGGGTMDQGQPATNDPAPVTPETTATPAALVENINHDLARLQSLRVLEVGPLVLSAGAQGASCYSLPCALDDADPVIVEYRRQAPRIARLADLTEGAAAATEVPSAPASALAADLEALRGLRIVEVQSLVVSTAAASPRCYNLPCSEDVAKAAAENQRRADVAHLLASEATTDPVTAPY